MPINFCPIGGHCKADCRIGKPLFQLLFNRYALGQVAGLIDITATPDS
jgi:hypothetical protein